MYTFILLFIIYYLLIIDKEIKRNMADIGKHVQGDQETKMSPPPKYDAPWYKGNFIYNC